MDAITAASLRAAVDDRAADAGISIRSRLDPIAGSFTPVKPAGYAGGRYQRDSRWHGAPPERTEAIVIDNVPSQANRLEHALKSLRSELGLPEIVLDLSGVETLPAHLPRSISSFAMPHRHADAYLRDAILAGKPFPRTQVGSALLDATADNPEALVRWVPQALLYGFWHSHLGKRRAQTKLARSWVSEIVGYGPATTPDDPTRGMGTKGDPLNLSVTERAAFQEDDLLAEAWSLEEGSTKADRATGRGASVSRKALSEIGHGQVPFREGEEALAPVSFRAVEQQATVSFAGLRRLGRGEEAAVMRALLVALGLAAHVTAFGRAFHLRSGCDLRPAQTAWTWLGDETDRSMTPLDDAEVRALVFDCRRAADSAGLLADGGWGTEPLVVTPAANLANAIRKTWPLPQLEPVGV